MTPSTCRACNAPLTETFVDLGETPLANAYLTADQLNLPEPAYPLHATVCRRCFLVQLQEFESPAAIFSDYAYFSSYSQTWLAHCEAYADNVAERFGLGASSHVVEIASNDGCLLQCFRCRDVDVLGVEPAANVAQVAIDNGVPTEVAFFDQTLAATLADRRRADLIVANNVLAHVPDLNGFVAGLRLLLAPQGVGTIEFPHLMQLMAHNQFDTIYHEHFSYFSLLAAEAVFARHGLRLFDVAELPTHGGSLRIYACHERAAHEQQPAVQHLRDAEAQYGLDRLETYRDFHLKVQQVKDNLLAFLTDAARDGRAVVGYGAPAKGNTLLNTCSVGTDLLSFTVDRSPHKQGRFLPGTHIPIRPVEAIAQAQPDFVLILPWNIADEIVSQMADIRGWGGRFVVPIPALEVLP